jgi:hypothetical protein
MDYTRLLNKILGERKGYGPGFLTLRTMTVSAVNSDGTVDLNIGGTTIPDVSQVESLTPLSVGDHVQVLTTRGQLLVVGYVSTGYPRRVVGQVSITPVASTPTSTTVTYPSLGGSGGISAQATANTSTAGYRVIEVSASSVGATSSLIWLYRTNTTTTGVFYTIERDTP